MNEDFSAISKPTSTQVAAIRKFYNKTRAEMAELIGISYRAYAHYETGYSTMHQSTWQLLLIKLGLISP